MSNHSDLISESVSSFKMHKVGQTFCCRLAGHNPDSIRNTVKNNSNKNTIYFWHKDDFLKRIRAWSVCQWKNTVLHIKIKSGRRRAASEEISTPLQPTKAIKRQLMANNCWSYFTCSSKNSDRHLKRRRFDSVICGSFSLKQTVAGEKVQTSQ